MKNLSDIPKTELHIHLEGAIPLPALFELIQKYGGQAGVQGSTDLFHRFQFRSFPEFIDAFAWKNSFLREPADFEFIARAIAQELISQKIVYANMLFSPTSFVHIPGLSVGSIVEAVTRGFNQVCGITIKLVADMVRDYGPAHEMLYLPELRELQSSGVVGIGLGGSEHAFPPENFSDLFREARQMGFRTTVHAGEASGPDSIWAAIQHLKPERIGHGFRAIEDLNLVRYLAETQIPLEICPISNVRTGVVSSITDHPVRDLLHRGVRVTINTDDPGMFHNTLMDEFELLQSHLGFTDGEIKQMITMGEEARW